MKIAFAPEAVDDLAAAVEYLRERNPQAAATTAAVVFSTIDRLAACEFEGPETMLAEQVKARLRGTTSSTDSISRTAVRASGAAN